MSKATGQQGQSVKQKLHQHGVKTSNKPPHVVAATCSSKEKGHLIFEAACVN
jgi:hypothetical protein